MLTQARWGYAGSTCSWLKYFFRVFLDKPVRLAISRFDNPSRKYHRLITLKRATSNTPHSPARTGQD
ncbi:Uncharacterised protein [Vibrio cholerae]|nr:Uncharacterised protein [Vibrio cholerae]